MTDIEIVPLELGAFRFPDPELAGRRGRRHGLRRPASRRDLPVRHRLRVRQHGARRDIPSRPASDQRGAVRRRRRSPRRDGRRELPPPRRPRRPERRLPRSPVQIHVQTAEWELAHTTDHTMLEWIERRARTPTSWSMATTRSTPAIRLIATPGHTAGHQSVAVGTPGAPVVVLAGQACYTAGEWAGDPTRSRAGAARQTAPPTIASIAHLRASTRSVVHFAHDRAGVDRRTRSVRLRACYPSGAVLGGELAVPCSLQSAPAGPNPLSRSPFSVAARRCDVEDRVPRSGEPRTVSGPEGSSTKRSSPGAAERPDPSRPTWWARATVDRRRVHGISIQPALDRRRS